MTKTFQCLLAGVVPSMDYWAKLQYPLIGSPKIDGVRVIAKEGVAYSRKMLPIPNRQVQNVFKDFSLDGLDGEIIVGGIVDNGDDDTVFTRTTSGIMTIQGKPHFKYYVFDNYIHQGGYKSRFIDKFSVPTEQLEVVVKHEHRLIPNVSKLIEYEEELHSLGFEGLMVRTFAGRYKNGRSTLTEGILLKVKRFADIDCKVIGFNEGFTNKNPPVKDGTGHTKRASANSHKVLNGTLGSMTVRDLSGKFNTEFSVSGGTAQWNKEVWSNQAFYLGKTLVVQYQPSGSFEKPRFPIAKGWRVD